MRRKVIMVGVVVAGLLWSSAPASAGINVVQTGLGNGLYMTSSIPSLPFVETVKYTGTPTGGGLQVVVACSAVAVGPAASVTISGCYASSAAGGSANAASISLPGPTAATGAPTTSESVESRHA